MLQMSNKKLCQSINERSVVKVSTCARLLFNVSIKEAVLRTFGRVVDIRGEQDFKFIWSPVESHRTTAFIKTDLKNQLNEKVFFGGCSRVNSQPKIIQ